MSYSLLLRLAIISTTTNSIILFHLRELRRVWSRHPLRLKKEAFVCIKLQMSSFLNVSVLILATMVLVLAGMVGYMYWQQNKVMSMVSSLSSFVASQLVPAPLQVEEESDEEDDRASVPEENHVEVVDKVELPEVKQETDVDDLQTKTSTELRDLLSKKGIPYGKRDSKSVLLQLLKASS